MNIEFIHKKKMRIKKEKNIGETLVIFQNENFG